MTRTATSQFNLLDWILTLSRHRVFLLAWVFVLTLASIVTVLLLPKTYTSTVVLMPPEDEKGNLSSLIKNLPIGKLPFNPSGLLGGGGGGSKENAFLVILLSRTMMEKTIDRFNLVEVYKFHEKKRYFIEDVFKKFMDKVTVDVTEQGALTIRVDDRSPQRAADMANFMAGQLDSIYKELTTESERNLRIFLEGRLELATNDLHAAESTLTAFLKYNKVLDIDEQSKATIEAVSGLEKKYLAAQFELELAKKVFSTNSPRVKELEMEIAQMGGQKKDFSTKKVSDLIIPLELGPDMALQYVRLKREFKVQETIYEMILQQYEYTKFEESRNTPNIQVLDEAKPAQKRTSPKRSKIVIACFVLAWILGIVLLIAWERIRNFGRDNPEGVQKLRTAARNLLGKRN